MLTVLRAALWLPHGVGELLRRYATAGGEYSQLEPTGQAALPDFAAFLMGKHTRTAATKSILSSKNSASACATVAGSLSEETALPHHALMLSDGCD